MIPIVDHSNDPAIQFTKDQELIARYLMQLRYCSVVGPRLTGKTSFAKSVIAILLKNSLIPSPFVPIYYDLRNNSFVAKHPFYTNLSQEIVNSITNTNGKIPAHSDINNIGGSSEIRQFLRDVLKENPQHFILLVIDHLEAVPEYIAKSLLECFRAIYEEREINGHEDLRRLSVLAVGTINILAITTNETSPFRSYKHVMQDIDQLAAQTFIASHQYDGHQLFDDDSINEILQVAGGDLHSIKEICNIGITLAGEGNKLPIEANQAKLLLNNFQVVRFPQSTAFLSALNYLQKDFATLELVQRLINGDETGWTGIEMESPLELSGAVTRRPTGGYLWRNHLYKSAVGSHYAPATLAELWANFDRWENAFNIVNYDDLLNPLDRSRFFTAVLSLIKETITINQAILIILKAISKLTNSQGVTFIVLSKSQKKIERVISGNSATNASSLNDIKMDGFISKAVIESFQKGKTYFEIYQGIPMVFFPFTNQSNHGVGVVMVTSSFGDKEYWHQSALIEEIANFASIASSTLSRIRNQEYIAHSYKQLKLISAISTGLLIGFLLSSLLTNFHIFALIIADNSIISLSNFGLITSLCVIVIIRTAQKIASSLLANLLAGIGLVVALSVALLKDQLGVLLGSPILLIVLLLCNAGFAWEIYRNRKS